MDKEQLIGENDEQTIEVELKRGTVTVRALTREESIQISDTKGTLDRDRKLVSWGMVEPELTYQDVARWQKQRGPASDIETVSEAIARASGMLPDAEREAVQRFPD